MPENTASKTKLFSKAFRQLIKLDELYKDPKVTKSFQNWSFYIFAHFLAHIVPPFCFAQAYRNSIIVRDYCRVVLFRTAFFIFSRRGREVFAHHPAEPRHTAS